MENVAKQTTTNNTDTVSSLLKDTSDWINIQDIIKLSFKAVLEVIKTQSESIKDMEQTLALKADKAELNAGLALKSNISEFTKIVSDAVSNKVTKQDLDKEFNVLLETIEGIIEKSQLKAKQEVITECQLNIKKVNEKIKTYKTQTYDTSAIDSKIAEMNNIITSLKIEIDGKVSKQVMNSSLSNKANKAEVEELITQRESKDNANAKLNVRLSGIESMLKAYEDSFTSYQENNQLKLKEYELLIVSYEESYKSEVSMLKKYVTENIQEKTNDMCTITTELQNLQNEIKNVYTSLPASLKTVEENAIMKAETKCKQTCDGINAKISEIAKLSSKVDDFANCKISLLQYCDKNAKNTIELEKCIVGMQKDFDSQINNKVEQNELLSDKQKLIGYIEAKISHDEATSLLATQRTQLMKEIDNIKSELLSEIQLCGKENMKEASKSLQDFESILKSISDKVDQSTFERRLKSKADIADFDTMKESVKGILLSQQTFIEYEKSINQLANHLQDANKELLLKANIKDVCTLIDMKASVEDINNVLSEINKIYAKKEDINKEITEIASINEALCSENCIGRWLWKSGELKSGNLIPWEIQNVNTCPTNYLWEVKKSIIVTVAPGLYEITLGFFNCRKPEISIYINGEPVLSANGRYEFT